MRALVTGGAGFIGSNLVDTLIRLGHEVVVIDNESAVVHEQFYWNDKASNHKEDICDFDRVRPLFENVDVVFHLAARSRIQLSLQNPTKTVMVNTYGTCNVLQCAREAGVNRVIYSSTSSAYGLTDPPHSEDGETDCLNPYSISKVSGERLCKMYTDLFGLDTVIFRYFNVYGNRHPLKGQYAPVIGLFQKQKSEGKPLTIVPDGEQRRDFTHVTDVVNANILASTAELESYGELFNIGSGVNHSILDLCDMISDDRVLIEPRPAEARETLADISKARQLLGWSPKVQLKDWINDNIR
tara:strand:+ start:378 stop:1271 length:894 start_codon:yes stop_codon:yes gene_type:complete